MKKIDLLLYSGIIGLISSFFIAKDNLIGSITGAAIQSSITLLENIIAAILFVTSITAIAIAIKNKDFK